MTRLRLSVLAAVVVTSAAVLGFAGPAASASAPTATNPLNAATNDQCFSCHGSPSAKGKTIDVDGVQKTIYVDRAVYEASRHGKLACTSCHLGFKPGPHDATQTQGWLMTAKITACRECHADVFAMYRGSFHGHLVFGESSGKAPVCADCHVAHNIVPPESPQFRAQIDTLCATLSSRFAQDLPRQLPRQGVLPRRPQDRRLHRLSRRASHPGAVRPASSVNQANLVQTCGQCHPGANENFVQFMVHVDPQSPHSSFLVWSFYAAYILLITVVFSFGFVHSGLYIYRGYKDGLYRRNH